MTTATRILLTNGAGTYPLGVLSKRKGGWEFMPHDAGRKRSAKLHPTWEGAIPRWTGHPDHTQSIRIEDGETAKDAMVKIMRRSAPAA
jgi:hypothetical protein